MTDKAAILFAKVSAANAEIEALKAENAYCEYIGRGITYGEEAFFPLQKKIEEAIAEFQKPDLRADVEPPRICAKCHHYETPIEEEPCTSCVHGDGGMDAKDKFMEPEA